MCARDPTRSRRPAPTTPPAARPEPVATATGSSPPRNECSCGTATAGTTIAAIAAESGVSPDTIYKGFGGKAGLVRAIRSEALKGVGPIPAEQRSDALHATTSDAKAIIGEWGRLTAEVAPLVTPILLLIRTAAASDPAARRLMEEMDADRFARMADNARRLHATGHLRRGISVDDATDVLWTYSAPELYELLVLRRGWTPQRFGRFAADAMIAALL